MTGLTHLDAQGRASMVDVSDKPVTARVAIARGRITMQADTLQKIVDGAMPKGDVLATARIAGIMAAKRTHELIPLCHALALAKVAVDLTPAHDPPAIEIEAQIRLTGQTGAEMEALTAVSVAALTIYDMVKAVDRTMQIGDIRLVHKSGGRTGAFDAA
ncbi:cyclic pyranopterin monophosphate synthase MoaC [Zavarzinia sp. CC-PAN008]|uniref:cyclic pyranopterin monophosphate synthase MoaC n=1 Tax=Zavarzinia sp. CC-PAN008 TaxID=3243332 RepID=UPI003F74A3F7